MTNVNKLINQLKRQYANGSPDHRVEKARQAFDTINQFRVRLQNSLTHQEDEYTRFRETWESARISGRLRPEEVEHQVRDGVIFSLFAWILTAVELATCWFLAGSFNVNPYFFLALALVLPTALKASLIAVWSNPSQPLEIKRRLGQYVISPSMIFLLLAVGVLLFGRVADEDLALALSSYFNIALLTLSLSCMGLAAGLFATAYLLLWSRRAVKKYYKTEQDLMIVLREGRMVIEIIRTLDRGGAPLPHAKAGFHNNYVMPPLTKLSGAVTPIVLCAAVLMSGCQKKADTQVSVDLPTRKASLHLINDWSISAEAESMNEYAQEIVEKLPELAEKHELTNCEISRFSNDGWNPVKIASIALPSLQHVSKSELGEVIGNVRQGQSKKRLANYRAQLQEKFAQISASSLVPPNDFPEPPCTDLIGVFKRAATAHQDELRIFVVITDGHESCGQTLRTINRPSSNTVLVVVILPEKVVGEVNPLKHEQFEQRAAAVAKLVPWAVIAPPFNDISMVISDAIRKAGISIESKGMALVQATN